MKSIHVVRTVLVACIAWLAGTNAYADLNPDFLHEFNRAHPKARIYTDGGTFNALYGTKFSGGATPLESAWNHINQWEGMFGNDIGELVPDVKPNGQVLQGVMYNRETQTHRFYTFRFNQVYNEIPVFRKGVGFLVRNQPDNPLVLSGFDVKDLEGFDIDRPGGDPVVTDAMTRNVRELMDTQPIARSVLNPVAPMEIEISDQKHVIWAGFNNVPADPELAVAFQAERGSVLTYPNHHKYLIVASVRTGQILLSETLIQDFVDVNGTVSGRATDGIRAAECDPTAAFRLPYAEVSIDGGATAFADENGDFTIPHPGNTPVTVRSRLEGRWFQVRDQSDSGSIPEISMQVTPPGPADFLHNPNDTERPTANVNCYLEANFIRDYVLSFEPTYPVIGTQPSFTINTNINANCNATYSGDAINFYTSGGGCVNTAFADVIYHEYGHHLIQVTGNGQGQMGEGTSDTVTVLIQDDPLIGTGFFAGDCSTAVRTADNNHQYPCNGGSHDCGQLLSGCIWDTRNELIITEPSDYLDINASLFLGMLIVRGQQTPGDSTISPFITLLYLQLDDDDNDIGNGTPHYCEIATGFGAHNMDAPPLDPSVLLDFNVVTGTHLGGDLEDLQDSDNNRLRIRNGFGDTLVESHKMELLVSGKSNICETPTTLDVLVEGRVTEPGGRATVLVRNWNTGQFEPVGAFAIGQTDTTATFAGLDASKYVDSDGSIDAIVKTVINGSNLSFSYVTQLDQVQFTVN